MANLLENSRGFLAAPAAATSSLDRRRRQIRVAFVLGLACFVVKTNSGYAAQTQTVGLGVAPTKLKKKKRSPVAVNITATTRDESADDRIPVPTVLAKFDFDNDFRFNGRSKVTGSCTPEEISGLSTALAIQQCPDAVLGSGSAKARIPWLDEQDDPWFLEVPAGLTAFRGSPQPVAGFPRLVILVDAAYAGFGSALIGTLKPIRSGGDFGTRLEITVPDFQAGQAALTSFSIRIGGGDARGYATAKCADRDRRLNLKGRVTYLDGSSLPASASRRCFPV